MERYPFAVTLLLVFFVRSAGGIGLAGLAWRPGAAGLLLAGALGLFAAVPMASPARLIAAGALSLVLYPLALRALGGLRGEDLALLRGRWPLRGDSAAPRPAGLSLK